MYFNKAVCLILVCRLVAGVPIVDRETYATASRTQKRGLGSFIGSLFGGLNSNTASKSSETSTKSSQQGGGGFSGFLDDLFGGLGSGSSNTQSSSSTSPSKSSSSSQEDGGDLFGFLGGLFGGSSGTSTPSTSSASGSTSSASSTQNSRSSSSGSDTASGGVQKAITAASGARGITYSPYKDNHDCKSKSQVASDIHRLRSYGLIRLYSTDCLGIENVLSAMSAHQKLFLGVWNIDNDSVRGGLEDIKKAVEGSSRGWSAVDTIAIGNERVNSGSSKPSDLKSAINTARAWLNNNASQYSGSVVTVDTVGAFLGNPELCGISDYIAVNAHPFWEGDVKPSDSGDWLKKQISQLKSVCHLSKNILITETGWPTEGETLKEAVPSVINQVLALESISRALKDQVIMFTTYNDYWKSPGPNGVEQHWGIYGNSPV